MKTYELRFGKKLSIMLIGLIIFLFQAPAFGADLDTKNRKVRVVFPQQQGFTEIDSAGNYSGYTYEYIEKAAEYNGWDLEFITFNGMNTDDAILAAFEMVASGKADIIGDVLKSDALTKQFEFCTNSYGVVNTTLAALKNNTFVSEVNFRRFSPLRVAVYRKAVTRNAEIETFLTQEGVSYELIPYDNSEAQMAALENGEADVMSNISLTNIPGTKTIASFAGRSYYFVSTKGNVELIDELDQALVNINYAFPFFRKQLQGKYFGDTAGGFSLSSSQQEFFRMEKKTLEVLCVNDSAPFVMQDRNGKACGVLISLLNDFAAETGVKLNYDLYNRSVPIEEKLSGKDYDIIVGIPINEKKLTIQGFIRSTPIDTVDIVAYHNVSYTKPISQSTVVLVNKSDRANTLNCKKVVYAPTIKDCVRMVKSGEADVGIDNRTTVSYYMADTFANFEIDPQVGHFATITMGVSKKNSNELLAILNNYIDSIPDDVLADYYARENTHNNRNAFETIIRTNPVQTTAFFCLFFFTVAAVVMLVINGRRKQRQYALLEKANAAKSEFLSRMSHDMRTPLNAVLGFTELAKEEENTQPVIRDYLEKIDTSGKYLLGLINDVLDMSKIDDGKLELKLEPYLFTDFKKTLETILMPKAVEKEVTFTINYNQAAPDSVMFDKLRLQQIFVNLIGNAIKFTPKGGTVSLTVSDEGTTADLRLPLTFTVKDNGIGMSEDFQKNRMYKTFEQEHNNESSSEAGTGLGLSITKRLVEQMGGTIDCESKLGKGTVFTVKLSPKIEDSKLKPADKTSCESELLPGKHILLCEDQPLNAQIVTKLMQKHGLTVETAENGKIGLDKFIAAKPGSYDAILMDIRMPVMDGIESAKAIRALERPDAKQIPIIAISANAFDDDMKKSLEAGMNAHISKPVNPLELCETLVVQFEKGTQSL